MLPSGKEEENLFATSDFTFRSKRVVNVKSWHIMEVGEYIASENKNVIFRGKTYILYVTNRALQTSNKVDNVYE